MGFDHRFANAGVRANAVMPGGITTPLQRHLPIEEPRAMGWLDENDRPITGFKSTEQGASTRVWAAVGTELEGFGGRYLEDCAEALPWSPERPRFGVRPYAVDPVSAERLWARSEGLVRVDLDGDDVVFMTSADTIKGKSILRDGRVALCWDDERPPFAFVTLRGGRRRAPTQTNCCARGRGSAGATWARSRPGRVWAT